MNNMNILNYKQEVIWPYFRQRKVFVYLSYTYECVRCAFQHGGVCSVAMLYANMRQDMRAVEARWQPPNSDPVGEG